MAEYEKHRVNQGSSIAKRQHAFGAARMNVAPVAGVLAAEQRFLDKTRLRFSRRQHIARRGGFAQYHMAHIARYRQAFIGSSWRW